MFYEPILDEDYVTCVHGHRKNTVKKKTSLKKIATKSQDLATKIFALVASWRLANKVNFEP